MPGKAKKLPYEQRKAIARELAKGDKLIKQVAADNRIPVRYAYIIFDEFLEWRVGWKEKENLNG